MTHLMTLSVSAALLLAAPQEPEPAGKKLSRQQADKALKAFAEKDGAGGGQPAALTDAALGKAVPTHHFALLLFRQFPVGRMPPKGLKVANVLAVGPDGKVQALTDDKELEKFFKAQARGVSTTDDQIKDLARAYLVLAAELRQDGFYSFSPQADSLKVEATAAGGKAGVGKAVVMRGGNGTVAVKVSVTKAGVFAAAVVEASLRPGPRPICQATKLLDADPVVRRMAEQDLLYLGRAARPYLLEQRRQAKSPELRRAIDRAWWQIDSE